MNSPIYWFMFGCIVMASINAFGCGHIDQDLELTDEEIEAKYADKLGLSGGWGVGGSYSTSCGGYGYGRSGHRSFSAARVSAIPEVGEAAQNAQNAQASAGIWLFVARRDEPEDEPDDDAPSRQFRNKSTPSK